MLSPSQFVIYARHSGGKNQHQGDSIATQLEKCRAYAAREGGIIVGEHIDEGLTGTDFARPAIHAAIAQCRKLKAVLLVASLSRLGRDVRGVLDAADALHSGKTGFVSLSESFVSDSAMGRLLTAILAATAAWEAEAIRERTTSTLAMLRRNNRRISRFAPYGTDIAPDGENLSENPVEQAIITEMVAMRAAGQSFESISTALNERGVPAKLGGAWTRRAVRLVLARLAKLEAA